MNALIFTIVLIFIFIFPVLIAFKVIRSLKKSGDKKTLRFVVIAGALGLVYLVYTAFYPTDGICIDKYERYTGLNFPKSGAIIAKDASISGKNSFADCFLIKMSANDYQTALKKIIDNNKFQPHDSFLVYSDQYKEVEKKLENRTFSKRFSDGSKAYIFLGFLDDKETIMLNIVARQSERSKLPPVINHRLVYLK
jgi:hypothetical protein